MRGLPTHERQTVQQPAAQRIEPGSPLRAAFLLALTLLVLLFEAPEADSPSFRVAYIGPGAGFAFLGSFLSLLIALLVGAASLLIWPFRVLWRALTRRQGLKNASIRKLIFLGLDGLEPDLTERFIEEGKMPNLARLRDQGRYRRLRTTYPPLSPVAWATFATGVNPGKHSMFDFLNRSMRTYMPELASSKVNKPRRHLRLGKWSIPLTRATVELRRKSRTFWNILGDQHVGCTILRVPITFPPEKFRGRLLSAMCTPDLLGTQGSFLHFTTGGGRESFAEGGNRYPLERGGQGLRGTIEGPENPLQEESGPMRLPFSLALGHDSEQAKLEVDGQTYTLKLNEYSPWVRLTFRAGFGVKVRGVCRFMLTSTRPEVSLYVTPINIDPENPALPISQPSYYATYLAKLLGVYSTLGLAEDTWALNERVIDEQGFIEQAYAICEEREAMFFSALDKTRQGVAACVFDTSDRVQHMFYRYLEPDHPAHAANPPTSNGDPSTSRDYRGAIEDLYRRMDAIVGRTMQYVDDDTVLFVLSDHGFKSFQRGINLNAWLRDNGYLHLKNGDGGAGAYLKAVDWSRTRAYTFGLAGIYVNQKGREGQGIVARGAEAEALRKELAEKLSGLLDEERNQVAIRRAYTKEAVYQGPYTDLAPDVVVGYNVGYRSSWGSTLGETAGPVFEDNRKAWSGDHCSDPAIIPGVVFCNRKFEAEDPGIEDLAPTALSLFGFKAPAYMDGRDLGVEDAKIDAQG